MHQREAPAFEGLPVICSIAAVYSQAPAQARGCNTPDSCLPPALYSWLAGSKAAFLKPCVCLALYHAVTLSFNLTPIAHHGNYLPLNHSLRLCLYSFSTASVSLVFDTYLFAC